MCQAIKPTPVPDPDSFDYWSAARSGRLVIPYCARCGRYFFPPRKVCFDCGAKSIFRHVSGRGRVFSFCVAHMPVIRGFSTPYLVAVVELVEQKGLFLTTNLTRCAPREAAIGMDVEVTFEPLTEEIHLPQFQPALRHGSGLIGDH